MTVIGHLDGLEGGHLVGWAHATDHTSSCRITVVDEGGNLVAKGRASRTRPDLACLNLGRTNVAFRIAGFDLTRSSVLHVLADGVELLNSPVVVGPGHFDGHLTVLHGFAFGWVNERTTDARPPVVRIVDQNGSVAAEVAAHRPAAADAAAYPQFRVALEPSCFGSGELRLTALANGVAFAETSFDPRLAGHIEILSPRRCAGWLCAPEAPHRTFTLELFADGRRIARMACNIFRGDIEKIHPGCGVCGFDCAIPPATLDPSRLSTITVRLPGSATDLLGAPYVIGSREASVAAARRVARLGLAEDGRLTAPERSLLHHAMRDFLGRRRQSDDHAPIRHTTEASPAPSALRFSVVIPIYRDVEVTRTCVASVLATRVSETDRIVLINDCSPDDGMASLLRSFAHHPNVTLLENETNLGFVQSVNRGFSFCARGDVILLNSDTTVFAGGLNEMWEVAHAARDIATVTAISNNATIFSYPHPGARLDRLEDAAWPEVAAIALAANRGLALEVPTGHGFCMLIKREVLNQVGRFDEKYGRGYGEENDFCARAADLGYRNVAAPGAFVEHRESVSFSAEKTALLQENLDRLTRSYPEYTPTIMEAERRDALRRGRWPLDIARLKAAAARGPFALIVLHKLGGGTLRARHDIEAAAGYEAVPKLCLSCRSDGILELACEDPLVLGVFAETETAELLALLDSVPISVVLVHQLLGFPLAFLQHFGAWFERRRSILYVHDYYPLCQRVDLVDALGEFCAVAPADFCDRCVALGGSHPSSRLHGLPAAEHRALFAGLFAAASHVVAPSASAALYLRSVFHGTTIHALPHPEPSAALPAAPRPGSDDEIVLFGALGTSKGAGKLLELARRARLTHPHLSFRVIGYTSVDAALLELGNVVITGRYAPEELPGHCAAARGRLALFLSMWPETYSYTLSEAVQFGFIPLVPDIGAQAERVRASAYGVVFPFPIDPPSVLSLLDGIAAGRIPLWTGEATPLSYRTAPEVYAACRAMFSEGAPTA